MNPTPVDDSILEDENDRLKEELESLRALLAQYEHQSPPHPSSPLHGKADGDLAAGEQLDGVFRSPPKPKRINLETFMEDCDLEASTSPVASRTAEETQSLEESKDIYSEPDGVDDKSPLSFQKIVFERGCWLVGLMIVQSMASIIIQSNEAMLEQHVVIVRFLTMVVGTGGNAGNQSAVGVIRGLAIGTIRRDTAQAYLKREFAVGFCLSVILCVAGCIRAAVSLTPIKPTMAIATSIFLIVVISVLLGATLPLGMQYVRIDPVHSSTTIQVLMDVIGVTIAVYIGALFLGTQTTVSQPCDGPYCSGLFGSLWGQ